MIEMADQSHDDDDDLAAAAAAALRQHDRIKTVLDDALESAALSMLAEQLDESEAGERFAAATWELLEARLDADDRIGAIAMLLEPLAEKRAHELNASFYSRLSQTPEVPHPLAGKEGRRA